jgi:hypothetical protein
LPCMKKIKLWQLFKKLALPTVTQRWLTGDIIETYKTVHGI